MDGSATQIKENLGELKQKVVKLKAEVFDCMKEIDIQSIMKQNKLKELNILEEKIERTEKPNGVKA